jgi:hypothetical protein
LARSTSTAAFSPESISPVAEFVVLEEPKRTEVRSSDKVEMLEGDTFDFGKDRVEYDRLF